jgi:hypothetical protein
LLSAEKSGGEATGAGTAGGGTVSGTGAGGLLICCMTANGSNVAASLFSSPSSLAGLVSTGLARSTAAFLSSISRFRFSLSSILFAFTICACDIPL